MLIMLDIGGRLGHGTGIMIISHLNHFKIS